MKFAAQECSIECIRWLADTLWSALIEYQEEMDLGWMWFADDTFRVEEVRDHVKWCGTGANGPSVSSRV